MTNSREGMVSVILPTYNEKDNVVPLIREIHACLNGYEHEILVMDDNSPDGTMQAVEDLSLPFVTGIRRLGDPGLAASIVDGIRSASGARVVVMDSDFDHDPRHLPFMIQQLEAHDCVVASRFLQDGSSGSFRLVLSRIFNMFVRAATGSRMTDNLYGYFAVRREVLFRLPLETIFRGYGDYFIRFLCALQDRGFRVRQFPARHVPRRTRGHVRLIGVFGQYVLTTLRLALRRRAHGYV
ncbi:MAG: glycosyltransferase [Candidatus Omnitrophota bacterium]|nr:glycosyltransferase [Candidatus Omnitrophota bacterium]MDZ4242987.1 glycosyltransferase [Candidatus Omnitrophota bacterium]